MSTANQGSKRKLAARVAAIAVLGYLGTFVPSLLAYWNETWYPHGREARVVQPAQNPELNVLGAQPELEAFFPEGIWVPEPEYAEPRPSFAPKQFPPVANDQSDDRGFARVRTDAGPMGSS